MAASLTDKFKKTYSSGNPNVTFVSSSRSAAATTLICDNLAGWTTDTSVDFITYKLDTDGETVVAGSQRDWKGIVSGNTVTNLTLITGGSDAGNDVNDIVEMTPTANWANDLVTGILVHANQDGTIKDSAVTADAIAASAVTTAKLANDAVTSAKLNVTPTTNSSWSVIDLGGVLILTITTASRSTSTSSGTQVTNLPTSLLSSLLSVSAVATEMTGEARVVVSVSSATTSAITLNYATTTGSGTAKAFITVIGTP